MYFQQFYSIVIRNAKESDFLKCFAIAKKAWPRFKERASIYHIFCKFFNNTCFVAEGDGEIQGFLLGFLSQVDSHEAYIHLVAVDPDYQRRGIARQLYQRFFKTVKKKRRRRISLIVNPGNVRSIAFHKKLQFHVIKKGQTIPVKKEKVVAMKDYNGPRKHMVLFRKNLQRKRG